ncbi:hypothetical protein P6F34_gp92 [Pseudomonas phage MiCath]|uniref:Uncharacterized protein n=1 Tax=Pseudomonas phage MiCath TaxID=3003729 RepID=A0AAF0AEL8_9CAUD|nr:hypothetical protein P6F34_gp92 [Pseudomonas phage MiCath]WAX22435.1 hypothetical protein [Pseudomonas phage MiCath]
MSEKILEALKKLDVENDNHWTADGAVRLDTIKMLAADPTITRDILDTVAPGFVRSNALSWTLPEKTGDSTEQQGASQAQGGEQSTAATTGTDSAANAQAGPTGAEQGGDTTEQPNAGSDINSDLLDEVFQASGNLEHLPPLGGYGVSDEDSPEATLKAMEARHDELLQARDQLNRFVQESDRQMDALRKTINDEQGNDNASAIRAYLNSQTEQAHARHRALVAVTGGDSRVAADLRKALDTRAPIDKK